MNWFEMLLIVAGVALDIFAAMECQGSLVRTINKTQLGIACVLIAGFQLIALFLGHFLSDLFCRTHQIPDEAMLGEIIAVVIFFGLGVRLIIKAIKNERIEEHLELNLGMRRFLLMAGTSSIYTVLAGIAFGFLRTSILLLLVLVVVVTVVSVISGMYVGYHFGFTQKTKAYYIGTVLLWVAGIDVLVRNVLVG